MTADEQGFAQVLGFQLEDPENGNPCYDLRGRFVDPSQGRPYFYSEVGGSERA